MPLSGRGLWQARHRGARPVFVSGPGAVGPEEDQNRSLTSRAEVARHVGRAGRVHPPLRWRRVDDRLARRGGGVGPRRGGRRLHRQFRRWNPLARPAEISVCLSDVIGELHLIVNQDAMEGLAAGDADDRAGRRPRMGAWASQEMNRQEDELTQQFGKDGMTLTDATPEEIKEATDKMRPYWDEWAKHAPGRCAEKLWEIRAAVGRLMLTVHEQRSRGAGRGQFHPAPTWLEKTCMTDLRSGDRRDGQSSSSPRSSPATCSISPSRSPRNSAATSSSSLPSSACRSARSIEPTTTCSLCRRGCRRGCRRPRMCCSTSCRCSFCPMLLWQLTRFVMSSFRFGRLAPTLLATPLWIPQASMPLGTIAASRLLDRAHCSATLAALAKRRRLSGEPLAFHLIVIVRRVPAAAGGRHGGAVRDRGAGGHLSAAAGRPDGAQRPRPGQLGQHEQLHAHRDPAVHADGGDHAAQRPDASASIGGLAKLVARLPGGLLQTNIAGCAIFASVSGSSIATAASIGGVALPQLVAAQLRPARWRPARSPPAARSASCCRRASR